MMSYKFKTWIFLGVVTFLFLSAGMYFGGRQGLLLAFALALTMNFVSFFYSKKIILWTYRARPLEGNDTYGINKILTNLAKKAEIPKPQAYLIPWSTPNSFSIGFTQETSLVAVTEGAIKNLTPQQLEAIIAHEVMHIKNHDTLLMMSAAVMGSIVMYFSQTLQWIALFGKSSNPDQPTHTVGKFISALFAPFAAVMVQLAVSKKLELLADQGAVELTGNQEALASALWKIHNYSLAKPLPATLSTAHLFLVSPLPKTGVAKLFKTHPSTEERIKNLTGRSPDAQP